MEKESQIKEIFDYYEKQRDRSEQSVILELLERASGSKRLSDAEAWGAGGEGLRRAGVSDTDSYPPLPDS